MLQGIKLTNTNRPNVLITLLTLNAKQSLERAVNYEYGHKINLIFDLKFPGGNSCRETPVPISNTAVKSTAPIVLVWRRTGRVGTARSKFKASAKLLGLFFVFMYGD